MFYFLLWITGLFALVVSIVLIILSGLPNTYGISIPFNPVFLTRAIFHPARKVTPIFKVFGDMLNLNIRGFISNLWNALI